MCLHSGTLLVKVTQRVLFSYPSSSLQHNLFPHLLLQGFGDPPLRSGGTPLLSKAGLGARRAAFRGRWGKHSSSFALLLCCWALGVACGAGGGVGLRGWVAQKAAGLGCALWCKAGRDAPVLNAVHFIYTYVPEQRWDCWYDVCVTP